MGQKTHPLGYRLGVTEDWKSRWYAPKNAYGNFLVEDERIRMAIQQHFAPSKVKKETIAAREAQNPMIAGVEIERTRDEVKVIIRTARPAIVIGSKGGQSELQDKLENLIDRNIRLSMIEIKQPALSAQLVGESICEQIKKRASFRRVLKTRAEEALSAGAKGVKIVLSGRLGGAELSRQEKVVLGSVPLTTLQAHIDYGFAEVVTQQGTIGCKVWIYKGYYGEEVADETVAGQDPRRRGPRRGKRA